MKLSLLTAFGEPGGEKYLDFLGDLWYAVLFLQHMKP